METYYDRVLSRPEDRPETSEDDPDYETVADVTLPPGVEDFLNQMGERFEGNAAGEDGEDKDDDS